MIIISCKHVAGLLKYFHRESKQKLPVLPDPKGEKVPSSIELTNDTSCHDILDKKTMPCGKRA